MGGCLSKKSTGASSPNALQKTHEEVKSYTQGEKKAEVETVRKEIFIIKHRKSHEIERMFEGEERKSKNDELLNNYGIIGSGSVRTSSCTKEELGAILTQCGKLSRSSTTEKSVVLGSGGSAGNSASNLQKGRKCICSERSFDFDNDNRDGCSTNEKIVVNGANDEVVAARQSRHRRQPSQAGEASSSFQGRRRRRTRSREREQAEQQLRSDSTERGISCGGRRRRVSRSPGRRSESPITSSNYANSSSANVNGDRGSKPGKMVSVPATISSLAMDNSNNAAGGDPISTAAVKRIHVKRNVGADNVVGSRTSARSPARANSRVCNENQNINTCQNQQHPMALSRSNSKKAEHSPYRRNPLGEIDTNVIVDHIPHSPGIKTNNNILSLKPVADNDRVVQGAKNKLDKSLTSVNCKANEQPQLKVEDTIGAYGLANNVALNVVTSGAESLPPLAKMRSRSSRLSRDLDINLEELSNPSPSYTALLLEDIHKFHQKNNTLPTFSLPPCLTRACSILEAVADLNSTTSSNLSTTFSDDGRRNPFTEKFTKRDSKDHLVESEVVANDDLVEPSFQKYVTVRRVTADHGDLEQQESSGSNSFISSQRHRDSSSQEPNSAESTDGRTSARSIGKQTDRSPLGFQRHAISEPTRDADGTGNSLSIKKTDYDYQLK